MYTNWKKNTEKFNRSYFRMSITRVFICILSSISVCRSIDIFWKIAKYKESQAETCLRNNLYPLSSDRIQQQWNESTIKNVVNNILGLSILSNGSNPFGIAGCCVSGLWCVNTTCFTQSYGTNFVNYGWLESNADANPVYTCHNDRSAEYLHVNSVTQFGGQIHLYGTGLGTPGTKTMISIHGSSCGKTQYCNCQTCSASSSTCSLDSRCYITDKKQSTGYCFQSCAGTFDYSCPCNNQCKNVLASDGSTVSLCMPADLNQFNDGCINKGSDQLICYANSTVYGFDYANLANITAGITLQTNGTAFTIHGSISRKCSSNSNCFDGNVCTQDECVNGRCIYTPAGQCDSILLDVKQSYTPYGYNWISISNLSSQSEFYSQMLQHGKQLTLNWNYKAAVAQITLPFWFLYFGNLVNIVYITATGSVSVPPLDSSACSAQECFLFTSYANTIAPWYSKDWNQGKAIVYVQKKNSVPYIRNTNANAVHILFQNMIKTDGSSNSTFSTSIYEDGSIRSSYFQGTDNYMASKYTDDFSGLWGAYASNSKSYLRYHVQNSSATIKPQKHELIYCPYNATACVVESCVSAGQDLFILWNGTESCGALTKDSSFVMDVFCNWHGGLNETHGSFVNATSISNSTGILACAVPNLSFSDGTLIPVEIIIRVRNQQTGESTEFFSNDDSKSIYSVTEGRSNELSRSNIMVRYYANTAPSKCGCSPLTAYGNKVCNKQNVCADATRKTYYVNDCAQTPFGSAFFDSCQTCSGGFSKNIPDFSCDNSSGNGIYNLLTQTIILLMVICCLTFITAKLSFSIRRMLMHRTANADVLAEHMLADLLEMANAANANQAAPRARGLTEFECDAIGIITFTNEFYKKHKQNLENREKEECSHDVIDFSENEKSDSCECSICLMDIQEGNICRVLPEPCGHIFHQSCIDEWFKQSAACPLCKRSMKTLLGLDDDVAAAAADIRPQFMYRPFTIRMRGPLNNDGSERATVRWVFNLEPPHPTGDGNAQVNEDSARILSSSRNISHPYQRVSSGSGIILDEDPEGNRRNTSSNIQLRDNPSSADI